MEQESHKSFIILYRPFILCSSISLPCGMRHIQPGSTLSHLWIFEVVSLFLFGHFVIYKTSELIFISKGINAIFVTFISLAT